MSASDKSGHGMLLIRADVDEPLTYVRFPDANFRAMAKAIGAEYIERVRVSEDMSMAVDEEGLLTDKPFNARASLLYGTHVHGAPICGDALLGIEEMTPEGVDWTGAHAPELYMRLRELVTQKSGE